MENEEQKIELTEEEKKRIAEELARDAAYKKNNPSDKKEEIPYCYA